MRFGAYANLRSLRELSRIEALLLPTKEPDHKDRVLLLAGVARFELTNKGVKVLCLTAWRYPYNKVGVKLIRQTLLAVPGEVFTRQEL